MLKRRVGVYVAVTSFDNIHYKIERNQGRNKNLTPISCVNPSDLTSDQSEGAQRRRKLCKMQPTNVANANHPFILFNYRRCSQMETCTCSSGFMSHKPHSNSYYRQTSIKTFFRRRYDEISLRFHTQIRSILLCVGRIYFACPVIKFNFSRDSSTVDYVTNIFKIYPIYCWISCT